MPADKVQKMDLRQWLLVLTVFWFALIGALTIPIGHCPDEEGRRLLSDYIYTEGKLPTGNEWETQIVYWDESHQFIVSNDEGYHGWGFSYALRPYLSAIIGALFMRLASLLSESPQVLLAASRMCSVLSVTGCCYYCLRLGRRVFSKTSSVILYAVLVCFLPQIMYLGMYQNNDALSLFAASMILCYMAEGIECNWQIRSCVGLAVGLSVGFLSYYSVYGWILMAGIFCIVSVLTAPGISNKGRLLASRVLIVTGICFLLAGWFFIRNAWFHEGDLLGIQSELASRANMRQRGYVLYDYQSFRDRGLSVLTFLLYKNGRWIRWTVHSFIGFFGYYEFLLPRVQYYLYYVLLGFGTLLFLAVLTRRRPSRRERLLMGMMLGSSLITVFLHFWQSYARDYQPQGRYVITLALPIGFMLAYSVDRVDLLLNKHESNLISIRLGRAIGTVWLLLFLWAVFGTMTLMLTPG